MHRFSKLIFIDLETTGPNPATDCITEIGIVEASAAGVRRWSTLVNPQTPIPPFIQRLTGISDAMVQDAPPFAALADEVRRRLQDGLFIAHNARFDYGFLRNTFSRFGISLRCEVLCTVKLSRKLFPHEAKHSLDALVARHKLSPQGRHRALADADLLWQFWRRLEALTPAGILNEAINQLLQRPRIPAQLDAELLDDLPDGPGAYVFHDEHDAPLYVGRGAQLRQRVLTHFPEHPSPRDALLAQRIRRVDWHETAGEIGAQLLEAQLKKKLRPLWGALPEHDACSWQLRDGPDGLPQPALVFASELDFGRCERLYGLFNSRGKAEMALQALAEKHGRRLESALEALRLAPWPHAGPAAFIETAHGRRDVHLLHNWCYLGSAQSEHDLRDILEQAPAQPAFDAGTYKTVTRALALGQVRVQPLPATATPPICY